MNKGIKRVTLKATLYIDEYVKTIKDKDDEDHIVRMTENEISITKNTIYRFIRRNKDKKIDETINFILGDEKKTRVEIFITADINIANEDEYIWFVNKYTDDDMIEYEYIGDEIVKEMNK